jgi:5-methylcytosine-specific restriction endonuclease McrA
MSRSSIVVYLNPWKRRRELERERLQALRHRDGDNCRRCRRPIRFDLPTGHDQSPSVQRIHSGTDVGPAPLANLCLCHVRCNADAGDATPQVQERLRLRAAEEAQPKRRSRKRASA